MEDTPGTWCVERAALMSDVPSQVGPFQALSFSISMFYPYMAHPKSTPSDYPVNPRTPDDRVLPMSYADWGNVLIMLLLCDHQEPRGNLKSRTQAAHSK